MLAIKSRTLHSLNPSHIPIYTHLGTSQGSLKSAQALRGSGPARSFRGPWETVSVREVADRPLLPWLLCQGCELPKALGAKERAQAGCSLCKIVTHHLEEGDIKHSRDELRKFL